MNNLSVADLSKLKELTQFMHATNELKTFTNESVYLSGGPNFIFKGIRIGCDYNWYDRATQDRRFVTICSCGFLYNPM
jgi:hypothetical protein